MPAQPRGEKSTSSSGTGTGGGWQRQEQAAWQQRSASFHGRAAERRQLPKQRPKTQPDLLAGMRAAGSSRSGSPGGGEETAEPGRSRRMPSKVLVSVSVQRSMWPLHVMASADWRVSDLVAAAVGLYVKEGRRPSLPATDPDAFGLHYSQFSLESLDPNERVLELGSRSFFLCPKSSSLGLEVSLPSNGATNGVTIREASSRKEGETPAWLSFMQFWPIM